MMHQYSVDYDRKTVYFLLAFVSILGTKIVNKILVLENIELTITGLTIFGLLFLLFDKFLWKIRLLYYLGLVKTPNLNGVWKGQLKSSYDDFKDEIDACIQIKQTWTKIIIFGKFNQSKSYSISANLETNNGARVVLRYVFKNKNNLANTPKTMMNHSGITTLEFEENDAEGKYYNEPPQNKNYGILLLNKEEKKKKRIKIWKKPSKN
ncbi:hypothetical protein MPH48_03570 [Lysinibacillus fusiformis]|uniref:Cap15 family cyclic dinucleotide receptor domain-containing protein n=1 Tax=Lysinibacillus fusiformis TaxID=28031 RepID=UPI001F4D63EB|nr:hypothetical protein [Lysinibacillus fusiformis]MCK1987178.1 hypothetical protein [Lysinibacillus fusiformis]